ncbi:ATP-binding protein [Streptomyces sp. NPDC046994]|uniref:ATP-binding protein n=1 Tax=Streptomyces sp. NPDC046994 TaxID=3155735 RepID=UPI003456EC3B
MSNFTEAVARRAGVSVEEATAVLQHHGVRESGVLPRPHRLALTYIEFSGTKAGKFTDDFRFMWPLSDGLWCLAADNLKGKSTVLEVIWWCLRGKNKRLQDTARRWISHVRLEGHVDGDPFSVEFRHKDGVPTGRLETGKTTPGIDFAGEAEFASVMSQFMMNRLNLEILRGWRSDVKGEEDGKASVTDWALFSHALICRNRNAEVLLGETSENGSVVSLLQMFIGLPWTSTRRDADTALKTVRQQQRGEKRRATEDTHARADALQELKDQVAAAELALADTGAAPALEDQAAAVERAAAHMASCAERHALAVQVQLTVQQNYTEVHQTLVDDRKRLRDLKENEAAKRYFGALTPTCCPRCTTPVVDLLQARGEQSADHCSVCGSAPPEDAPQDTTAIDQLSESIEALAAADEQTRTALRRAEKERETAAASLREARQAMAAAQAALPDASVLRRQLELERWRGALAEREATHARAGGTVQPDPEEKVLESASKEADLRAGKASKPIMDRVSSEILNLAVRLGYSNLQDVKLQANGPMMLHLDDGPSSFNRVTEGEQLRLRMATLLALLRVGQQHGGRHPGLFLIDSAGAQEMIQTDLAETLQQLRAICDETGGLQIIAATANRELARTVIPEDRAKIAEPGAFMW